MAKLHLSPPQLLAALEAARLAVAAGVPGAGVRYDVLRRALGVHPTQRGKRRAFADLPPGVRHA